MVTCWDCGKPIVFRKDKATGKIIPIHVRTGKCQ